MDAHSKEPVALAKALREAPSEARPIPNPRSRTNTEDKTAAAQMLRLLAVLPVLGSHEMVDLAGLPERTGISVETVPRDLTAVAQRIDVPAGFIDPLQVYFEGNKLGLVASQFLRPPRLNHDELLALELGLAMLRRESPPDDQPWIDRARVRLRAALASAEPRACSGGSLDVITADGMGTATEHERKTLRTLRGTFTDRRKVRIEYRARGRVTDRIIRVYAVAFAGGAWYVIAHCDDRGVVRRFRLDRIGAAGVLGETYDIPTKFAVLAETDDHRALSSTQSPSNLRVRFGPRIARWIAEREGLAVINGAVTVDYSLLDTDWAVAFVLRYGADAEVIEPEAIRDAIRKRLGAIAKSAEK